MRVLIAGETWSTHKIEIKGFAAYTTGGYGVGLTEWAEAVRSAGHEVTHIANHEAIERFPWTVEEFQEHDVVVLSDIPADTIQLHPRVFDHNERTPDRLRVLADFVRGGGGLLMVGGYMSFSGIGGQAHYQFTPVADVLPVVMLPADDRVELPAGVNPAVARPEHPILAGIPADWPYFLGYNRVEAKPGADVLLTADADPFLVVDSYGDGRAAAFASDCSPHWGSTEFTGWQHYGTFWGQLIDWLGGAGS